MTTIRGVALAGVALALSACGGGVEQDDGSSQAPLVCATTCTDSSTLQTAQIRHSYALVSDGQQLQAQAAFSTGNDLRFNVALAGGDQLLLATPQGTTQEFHIPAQNIFTVMVDAFATMLAGAKPYLSEVTPLPTAAAAYEFRFVRNGATMAAPVTLPPPFSITLPVANSVLNIAAPSFSVHLSAVGLYSFNADFDCNDANGNTAKTTMAMMALGAAQNVGGGTTYTLDLASAVNGLQFSTEHPRGAISSCTVGLQALTEAEGVPNVAFASGSRVFAQQLRSTSFTLMPLP